MTRIDAEAIPALTAGACQVWWAKVTVGERLLKLLGLLDAGERARWATLRPPDARARYLAAHALTRIVLGGHLAVPPAALTFTRTCRRCGGAHGKPRLRDPAADLRLSVAHSGEWVVVAVALGVEVGVDVEQTGAGGDLDGVAGLALSAPEQAVWRRLAPAERTAALLRYWVRKEALLKATGDGLAVAPASLTVTPPTRPPALLAWTAQPPLRDPVHLTDLHPDSGHVGCLAMLGAALTVTEHDATALLT